MKINHTGSIRGTAPRRKNGADAAGGGEFAAQLGSSTSAKSAGVGGATQISSVEALIALQAGGPAEDQGNRPEIDRAEDLLDRLDRIRVGILTGTISPADLKALVMRLDARRRDGVDPRLASIVDEIELRAKVELAKLAMI